MWPRVFWSVAGVVLVAAAVIMALLGHLRLRAPGRLTAIYRRHFDTPRRERLFLSSVAFFVTFVVVRGVTHAIRAGVRGLHDVEAGGLHVHHLVWGILLLLGVGYAWLLQVGTGQAVGTRGGSRLTAMLYGVGAALTLDEFALWLRLQDVYWTREGRESIEAVLLFGGLLSVGLWGAPFFRGLVRETARLLRR
ncbi:MAG TPA: hypothetical protein VFL90_21025 [Methylomirabilota bacterium]|nr:hypothetical protein [Methylomirabilota bacterium]